MSLNITLIGMAGSGKSTIGKALSEKLNKSFIDSDKLIEEQLQMPLQQILEDNGYLKLRQIEAELIQTIEMDNTVLATGGSAVYSPHAMQHLALQSTIIYLQVPLEAIYERVEDFENRGFAKHPDQTIEEVYRERVSLYERYTDLTIENINSADICIEAIIKKLK